MYPRKANEFLNNIIMLYLQVPSTFYFKIILKKCYSNNLSVITFNGWMFVKNKLLKALYDYSPSLKQQNNRPEFGALFHMYQN